MKVVRLATFLLVFTFLSVICKNAENPTTENNETDESLNSVDKLDENISKVKEPSKTDDEVVKREEEAISVDGLNVEQLKELREKSEKYAFQAEVDRMMKLIINSLYKNKEIFLRELISNASDALDKIRFVALTTSDSHHDDDDLIIKIKVDKDSNTLHLLDTGIGMTKNDLINSLGTIAKSGTNEFLTKIAETKSAAELNDLIGQFGVGFYSSFLVADRVTVVSKSDADKQYIWESDATSFSVIEDPRGSTLKRGTEVILHMKDEAADYLSEDTLEELINKYSQFINFPIYLWKGTVQKSESNEETAVSQSNEDATVTNEEEKNKVNNVVMDWVLINRSKPIWTRKSGEVSNEEYDEFYKSFTKDKTKPISRTHFSAEGEVNFKSLMYIPKNFDEDQNTMNYKPLNNIKLYVKRVFITDNFENILPRYLSFIKGIVDSDDLPLNVSRETLQQHKLSKIIRKKLVRKILDMFKKIPNEQYKVFWEKYGNMIKMGIIEDNTNRIRLSKLLRYNSSYSNSTLTSLTDYVSRMKPKQETIYFIGGMSLSELKNSPLVETLLVHKYEVLYLTDPMDEYTIQSLPDFEGKKFQNLAKEGFKLPESDKIKLDYEQMKKEYKDLTDWLTEYVLEDRISKVDISDKLTESPTAIIAPEQGMSGNMERILRAQSFITFDSSFTSNRPDDKKILEINPNHILIKYLKHSYAYSPNKERPKRLANLLYDCALLRSGYVIRDVAKFTNEINEYVQSALEVDLLSDYYDVPRQYENKKNNTSEINKTMAEGS